MNKTDAIWTVGRATIGTAVKIAAPGCTGPGTPER